jgi:hypothetical protein
MNAPEAAVTAAMSEDRFSTESGSPSAVLLCRTSANSGSEPLHSITRSAIAST